MPRATWHLYLNRTAATQAAIPGTRRFVADAGRRVLNRGIVRTPVDTGRLRGGHQLRMRSTGLKIRAEVSNSVRYAMDVHDGTAPHVIRAKPGRALRFTVGGRTVFATAVQHPGTKPRPWLALALRETLEGRDGWRVRTSSGRRG